LHKAHLQGRASVHIICCAVAIVLREVLLFWYLTEAADSSPSGVMNEGDVLCSLNSTWPIANEGHHYQRSCEVTGVKWRGVCGGGGGGGGLCQLKGEMGLIFLIA